jgi:hypothetical protein
MQPRPSVGPVIDAAQVSALLRRFVDAGSRSFEATVDDLARVRVGSDMKVLAVEFLDPAIDPALRQRPEAAAAGAINTALQRAALAAGQALSDLTPHTTSDA